LAPFGELGVTNNEADLDPVERKVFRAFGRAQARTNLPIFTHNNYSTGANVPMDMAVRQLDALEAGGANPKSIALGHVCCLFDPMVDIHKKVARRGAFIAFDRVTRQQQWVSDEKRIVMLKALLDAGLEQNILLSSDYIGRVNTGVGEINGYPGPAARGARAAPAMRDHSCCSCRSSSRPAFPPTSSAASPRTTHGGS
jgi:predicted metal-dependent phosphotriesterase family hydrolase